MSCLAGAILSPLLVDVGETMRFIISCTVLVATGRLVLGSARAEVFEGLDVSGWTVPCLTSGARVHGSLVFIL